MGQAKAFICVDRQGQYLVLTELLKHEPSVPSRNNKHSLADGNGSGGEPAKLKDGSR